MLKRVSEFVVRFRWPIVVIWILLAALVIWKSPILSEVAETDSKSFLPGDTDSSKASKLLQELYPDQAGSSSLILTLQDKGGINDRDRKYAKDLENYLKNNKNRYKIRDIISPFSRKEIEKAMMSKNGEVAFVMVRLTTPGFKDVTNEAVRSIRQIVQSKSESGYNGAPPLPSGLKIHVTGEAPIGQERADAIQESMAITGRITVILVAFILIIIYRSPVAPLVPLFTIGLSFMISRGLVAGLTTLGLNVSSFTETFLIAILFGAGTDYCLLIVSRFREEIASGKSVNEALSITLPSAGEAVISSGSTVIVGFAFMIFAKFGLFSTTGPSIAIGVAVTILAALTLTPALLAISGERIFWPMYPSKTSSRKSGGGRFWNRLSNAVTSKPLRFMAISLIILIPFLIMAKDVTRSFDQLADLPDANDAVKGFGVLKDNFDQGELVPVRIVMKTDKNIWSNKSLQALDEVADNVSKIGNVAKVRTATRPLGDKISGLGKLSMGVNSSRQGVDKVNVMLQGVQKELESLVTQRPELVSDPSFQRAYGTVKGLQPNISKISSGLGQVQGGFSSTQSGVFYLPPGTLERYPQLRKAMEYYIAPDGNGVVLDVVLSTPPYTNKSLDTIGEIKRVVADTLRGSSLEGSEFYVGGGISSLNELRQITADDLINVMIFVLAGVFLILVILLRSFIAPIYLLLTILVSFAATLGITGLVFQVGLGYEGLDWSVPFFAFCLLVALGVDYNIFLMSRVKEEYRPGDVTGGVARALSSTGRVITSCGIIMAGTFGALMASPLDSLVTLGFATVVGLLLDTFIIRSLLVPAIAVKVGELNWWPSKKVKLVLVDG